MRPLIIFLLLIQSAWAAWSYSGTSGDFAYSATYDQTPGGAFEGTASITGYTGSASSVVIPESVNFTASHGGQNVTVNCAVTKIQYGNGQPGVFQDKTSITSVSIPSSLQSIERFSFSGCSGLVSVIIPSGVTLIGDYAFLGCTSLTNFVMNEGLVSIGRWCFRDCSLLSSIYVPSTVLQMGFSQGSNGIYYTPFEGCTGLSSVSIGNGADIGDGAFQNLGNLNTLTFVGQVSSANPGSIGSFAFHGTGIQAVTIPGSITYMGTHAFSSCPLQSVVISEGATSIGSYAFTSLPGISNIVIPASITDFGTGAFAHCVNLTSVNMTVGLTRIGEQAFRGCKALQSVTIPSSVSNIENYSFDGCSQLASITIPPNVTRIGSSAFGECSKLASVVFTILSNVTSIGESAFWGCTELSSMTIPFSVETLGHGAFSSCSELESIALSPGLGVIDTATFSWCVSLRSIAIPAGVTSIRSSAFQGCTVLTSVTIPAGVTSIGDYAFANCQNLKSTFYQGNAPTIGSSVFNDSPGAGLYYLPGTSGFTSPTWQGYPTFIAATYGGVIHNLTTNEAHLIGGSPADGNVKLDAALTQAPLLWQRQMTAVTLDMESSRILRLGATGTVRIEAGDGALDIGRSVGDGFLTAGGAANTPGILVLDNASSNDITVHADISNNGSGVVGLSKTSSGRAVLVGMNTYSGNTAIFGGTLVLKSPCLADASAVTISSGSTLNLDYAGADIVSSLTISGTAKPNGLYDSTNTSGSITGTGKIQVGPFANFAAWSSAIAPGQTGNQDHDNDGVPNGVEYFMGKAGNDFTPNPGIAPDGTVTWPKGASFVGTYQIQTSINLSNWTDVTNDPAQVAINPTSVIWTRPAAIGNLFVRLVISPN